MNSNTVNIVICFLVPILASCGGGGGSAAPVDDPGTP